MNLLDRIAKGMDALAGRQPPPPYVPPESEPEPDAPPPEPQGPHPFPEGYVPSEAEYLDATDGRARLVVLVDRDGRILPVRWTGDIGPITRADLAARATVHLIADAAREVGAAYDLMEEAAHREIEGLRAQIAALRSEARYDGEIDDGHGRHQ